ncbi:unnamed protein product [Amoebophrya sp. A120]|nr:unnamed protein product [Amoebophrya sp. A120]|eukprot:GSA120T00015692001.1
MVPAPGVLLHHHASRKTLPDRDYHRTSRLCGTYGTQLCGNVPSNMAQFSEYERPKQFPFDVDSRTSALVKASNSKATSRSKNTDVGSTAAGRAGDFDNYCITDVENFNQNDEKLPAGCTSQHPYPFHTNPLTGTSAQRLPIWYGRATQLARDCESPPPDEQRARGMLFGGLQVRSGLAMQENNRARRPEESETENTARHGSGGSPPRLGVPWSRREVEEWNQKSVAAKKQILHNAHADLLSPYEIRTNSGSRAASPRGQLVPQGGSSCTKNYGETTTTGATLSSLNAVSSSITGGSNGQVEDAETSSKMNSGEAAAKKDDGNYTKMNTIKSTHDSAAAGRNNFHQSSYALNFTRYHDQELTANRDLPKNPDFSILRSPRFVEKGQFTGPGDVTEPGSLMHQKHMKSSLVRDTFYERAASARAWEVAELSVSGLDPYEDEQTVKTKCRGFGCHIVKVMLDLDPVSNRCKGRAKLILRYNPDENDLNGLIDKIQAHIGWHVLFLGDEA